MKEKAMISIIAIVLLIVPPGFLQALGQQCLSGRMVPDSALHLPAPRANLNKTAPIHQHARPKVNRKIMTSTVQQA